MQPTYPSGGLAVSPHGTSLLFSAFYRRGEGESGIFTLPTGGGQPVRLDTGNARDREPAWSPDGRSIAFVRREQGADEEEIDNIWVMGVDGEGARRITAAEDQVTMASIRWSPDGDLIAFYGRDRTLRVVAADGGESRIVVPKVGGGLRWQGLDWSPDGELIAYVTARRIWLAPRDGGEATSIETGLDARISKIDWSPDGKTIAFIATTGGEHELWLLEDLLEAKAN
jgi:Tol biopolymer transport system component